MKAAMATGVVGAVAGVLVLALGLLQTCTRYYGVWGAGCADCFGVNAVCACPTPLALPLIAIGVVVLGSCPSVSAIAANAEDHAE